MSTDLDPTSAKMAVDLDTRTQEILLAASRHDVAALKPYLREPGAASVQDPETGMTPLHAAIGACEHDEEKEEKESNENESVDIEKAKATVQELLFSGAIWNDLDSNNETPGCLAWRIGQKELYSMIVDAGVRAEMLLNLMGGYEQLEDEDDDEEENGQDQNEAEGIVVEGNEEQNEEPVNEPTDDDRVKRVKMSKDTDDNENDDTKQSTTTTAQDATAVDVNSADYLASNLSFTSQKLLDADANAVMMAWETDIMRRSVDLLTAAPTPSLKDEAEEDETGREEETNNTSSPRTTAGLRILNIGFGMGIIDTMFAATQPSAHHIIEAHPSVLTQLRSPESAFGAAWEALAPGKNVIHGGRWQDVVPELVAAGEVFDVIYFDTFAEDYAALREFFQEYVIALLDEKGRFGFFNGLGADRRVCYDVYTKVVELDLCEAGFDVEWYEVKVDELGGEGEGEWEGVRRRYWTLDTYRLPICTFMG